MVVKPFFEEMGIEVVAALTGDARVAEIQRAHTAQLNLVQCSGSMTYLAKKMEEKYGIPYRRNKLLRPGGHGIGPANGG